MGSVARDRCRQNGSFGPAVEREDFEAAMRAMARLRPHVDAFFDKVTVNVADGADKQKLRENRLRLLDEIRSATRTVDFSRIEGLRDSGPAGRSVPGRAGEKYPQACRSFLLHCNA